jgi:peptidyl-prolyl cis-trans isomerase B (cyclophilin B)
VPTSKQRREAARRHLERQLARRQQQQSANRRRNLIASIAAGIVLVAVVVVFIVAVTHDDKNSSAAASGSASAAPTSAAASSPATSSPAASTSAATEPSAHVTAADGTVSCTYTKSGQAAKPATIPGAKETTKGTAVATLDTTQGKIVISMDRAKAPCTVDSFVSLAKQNYFNKTACHRLTTSSLYVLQCGSPSGANDPGPGYTVPDEYTGTEKYTAGVVAMANTGQPDSNGSEFFIVYKDSTTLPASYTIFGTVTSGLDVVQKVAAAGAPNNDGAPKLPITINTATITG